MLRKKDVVVAVVVIAEVDNDDDDVVVVVVTDDVAVEVVVVVIVAVVVVLVVEVTVVVIAAVVVGSKPNLTTRAGDVNEPKYATLCVESQTPAYNSISSEFPDAAPIRVKVVKSTATTFPGAVPK